VQFNSKGPGHNWQPGLVTRWQVTSHIAPKNIGADLYIVPAIWAGAGLERRVSSYGYYPRCGPPDIHRDFFFCMFPLHIPRGWITDATFVIDVERGLPHKVLARISVTIEYLP
jgi:hypothetical protein